MYGGLLGGFAFNGAGVYIGHFSPFVSMIGCGIEAGAVSALACMPIEDKNLFVAEVYSLVRQIASRLGVSHVPILKGCL
jgi:hypothetical protein